MDYYILNENGDIQKSDALEWSKWFIEQKKICQDFVNDIKISTVFLATDHNYSGVGPPVLFETMIFGGYFNHYQQRYHTKKEAIDGHALCLSEVNISLRLQAMIKVESLVASSGDPDFEGVFGKKFQEWKADHLLGKTYFFQCGNYIGFDKKEDAAVFMLSHWFNPPKDID